jgi:hypothetical protein
MMPLPVRRKGRKLEKVENLCRTATAQSIFPTRPDTGITLALFRARRPPGGNRSQEPGRPLPKISDFAAELYECCAGRRAPLNAALKFGGLAQASCDAA